MGNITKTYNVTSIEVELTFINALVFYLILLNI